MPIHPKQPTAKGPAEWFTGDVYIDGIARGEEPSRVRVSTVRFTPSARTAWHSHAVGQTLYVTEGMGLVQSRGGAIEQIRAGDVIYTPADEWHWHGAAPDHFMTHLSITEAVPDDQRPEAQWREGVSVLEIALWREGISVVPFMGTPRGGPVSWRTRTDQLKWGEHFHTSALQVRIRKSLPGLSGQAASKDVGSVGVSDR